MEWLWEALLGAVVPEAWVMAVGGSSECGLAGRSECGLIHRLG